MSASAMQPDYPDIRDPAMDDNIHDAIEKAINARIDLADTLVREANSLMRCRPEKFIQLELSRRREQYP
jgi:hypothetical protein